MIKNHKLIMCFNNGIKWIYIYKKKEIFEMLAYCNALT